MSKFRRRTRLFIARRFQIRYIGLILIFIFLTAILTGYTVYMTTWVMFGEKLARVYPQGLLLDIIKNVNMALLLRLVFLGLIVILVALVLSNRIAGPIFRIQRFLRRVSRGNYENRLILREKDELQDLAESLNRLVSKLSQERNKRQKRIDTAKQEVDKIVAQVKVDAYNKKDLLKKIMILKEDLNKLT